MKQHILKWICQCLGHNFWVLDDAYSPDNVHILHPIIRLECGRCKKRRDIVTVK